MILLIDNYDSFSYNLYQLLGQFGVPVAVVRNDEISIETIEELAPAAIFLSPGPGRPEDAGICIPVITAFASRCPIFGVCLGHQAIAVAFGGVVTYARTLMHGKTSEILCDDDSRLFHGLGETLRAARYHSLVASEDRLIGTGLVVTARTRDGEVMALEHERYPVCGVQFHPESIMTDVGYAIVRNYLSSIGMEV
ncbi:MAG: anthranilate synthase component II [Sphaerochaetaceae bacterium]|jgi:anthranilate synthase component 2